MEIVDIHNQCTVQYVQHKTTAIDIYQLYSLSTFTWSAARFTFCQLHTVETVQGLLFILETVQFPHYAACAVYHTEIWNIEIIFHSTLPRE